MVIWLKFIHPVHFSSLIPKMLIFTLAISCLTTSNLPWLMYLTIQVPMQYCSLQNQTLLALPVTSTAGRYFCFVSVSSFFPELFLHSSLVSILGPYWPGEFIFQCHVFLPFHTVCGILKEKILKWFAIPFFNEPHFVRTLHHDLSILGGPTRHGSQFYWVRQGCDPYDHFD